MGLQGIGLSDGGLACAEEVGDIEDGLKHDQFRSNQKSARSVEIPAQAGIQYSRLNSLLDPRLRGDFKKCIQLI
jgi:hypothetical protein